MSYKSIKHKIGCDVWNLSIFPLEFFKLCKERRIEIYHFEQHDSIVFHSSIINRYRILHTFPNCIYVRSYGIGANVIKVFTLQRCLMLSVCIVLFCLFPRFIYKIEYHGDEVGKLFIQSKLNQLKIDGSLYQYSEGELEMILKDHFVWIDVQKKGAIYHITYRGMIEKEKQQRSGGCIIAKKAGMITHYEIESGSKKVNINEMVQQGDLLVDGIVVSTNHKNYQINVMGKVYAKTWQDVVVSKKSKNKPNAFDFFQLLLQARNEISKDFEEDDEILKENILHFKHNKGKIELYVHYELLQNIAMLQE